MNKPVRSIIILGGGSAGLLTALALKRNFPSLRIELIRSSEIGTIMVGEGSTHVMPAHLHGYLGIDPAEFHARVMPTYKLGIRFLWGPRPRFHFTFSLQQLDYRYFTLPKPNGFYCNEDFDFADINAALMAHNRAFERQDDGSPLVTAKVGYHLENAHLVEFLESRVRSAGIAVFDDTLAEVEQDETGITSLRLASGRTAKADLFVDCSGFRSELLGKALGEPFSPFSASLPCDRAVVGGWKRSGEPLLAFTTVETYRSGWAWQIEHDDLINRGYVFSSAFQSDDEAIREFLEKNPKIKDCRIVRFMTGRHERNWVKNVVAIGNAAGFVEPLEATSLATITDFSRLLVAVIEDGDGCLRQPLIDLFNRETADSWDEIRRMLALHYRFNGRIDSEFWRHCAEKIDLAGAESIVEHYREFGPCTTFGKKMLKGRNAWGWEAYLVWLLGPQAPTSRSYQPGPGERQTWQEIKRGLQSRARQAMDQEEALLLIRSDLWNWDPRFYRDSPL